MKILKWVLIFGGLGLVCYGVFTFFYEYPILETQLIGMIGVGILTILAGVSIKKRK